MYERRKFLRQLAIGLPSLYLGATGLSSCVSNERPPIPSSNIEGKILIIGAGAAGLHAAQLFANERIDFEIVEASSRIGGRILTKTGLGGVPLEMGAAFQYGSNNAFGDLLAAENVTGAALDGNPHVYYDNRIQRLSTLQDEGAFQSIFRVLENLDAAGAQVSVADFAQAEGLSPPQQAFLKASLGDLLGTDLAQQSALGLYQKLSLLEGNEWATANLANRNLAAVLERHYAAVIDQVQLNRPIGLIRYRSQELVAETDSGARIFADRVLVTVPIAVLQAGGLAFDPVLPTDRLDLINAVRMPRAIRVYLRFTERFWDNTIQQLWTDGRYVLFSDASTNDHPILMATVYDATADLLLSVNDFVITAALQDLDAAFGGGIATSTFVDAELLDWSTVPTIGGGISTLPPGSDLNTRLQLAAPFRNRIFFAGEAFATNGYAGTVSGAISSSTKAVNDIIQSF